MTSSDETRGIASAAASQRLDSMTTDATSTNLTTGLSQEEMLARVRRLQIRARRLVRRLFLGEYHSVFRGRGLEFSEVREYQPGDEVRLIDWNVTARMGEPYIKKFVEERELVLYLLVDVSPSSGFSTCSTRGDGTPASWASCINTASASRPGAREGDGEAP